MTHALDTAAIFTWQFPRHAKDRLITAPPTETSMRSIFPPATLVPATVLAFISIVGAAALAQSRSHLTIPSPAGPRHAVVLAAAGAPHPTVIVLHGALGTGGGTAMTTGFAEAAARRGFTAVFPDGIHTQWHDGRAGGPDGPDDVGFIRELVRRLVADGVADPRRIYLAGISNGGMMSFTLACKSGDLFAGIGTVIANMPAGIEPCTPRPMPVVMVNGTNDPMVPYGGGEVGLRGGRGEVWSVERTAGFFAERDGCGQPVSEALAHQDQAEETAVTRFSWSNCRPGTSVTLYRVEGGGHALPGRRSLLPRILGPSNHDIVGAEVIMDAFAQTPDR
jgi:polyhydroxybutyrate depolymerase